MMAEKLDCRTPDCRAWLDSVCPTKEVNTSLERCKVARTGSAVSLLSSLFPLLPPLPSAAEVCVVVWPALELLLLPYGG